MEKQSFRIVLGRDEQGGDIAFDLATLPHLLIGGSTGSGKSVCIKSILSQLMRTKSPDEVKFIISMRSAASSGGWEIVLICSSR